MDVIAYMRHLIIVFIIVNFGCRTKEAPNENVVEPDAVLVDEDEYDEGETGCAYAKTYKKPENIYPFDRSDKIELVSYDTRRDSYSNDELIQDGKFTLSKSALTKIEQRIRLDKTQSDSLFSILYNYKKIRHGNFESVADCYNPRHSIVFYQNGRAIAFLEICFTCNGTRQTKDVDFGEFCDEKWCVLQKFFEANKADYALFDEMCP